MHGAPCCVWTMPEDSLRQTFGHGAKKIEQVLFDCPAKLLFRRIVQNVHACLRRSKLVILAEIQGALPMRTVYHWTLICCLLVACGGDDDDDEDGNAGSAVGSCYDMCGAQ